MSLLPPGGHFWNVSSMAFAGHASLSFAGNSYIKYRLSGSSREDAFRLALRLRTLQSNGVLMFTRANPCLVLKVIAVPVPAARVGSRWALLKAFPVSQRPKPMCV